MNKKKVLVFTPGSVGGAERMTINIVKMLPQHMFDVHVACVGKDTSIMSFIPDRIETSQITSRNIIKIIIAIAKKMPDLVFTSSVLLNPRVIVASKLLGVKVIARSSGMVGYYNKSDFRKVKLSYPLATRLIAQQEDMRQELSEMLHIPLERIVTLKNPVDTETIDSLRKDTSPFLHKDCCNYVNVSRIQPVKAHDVAIKALAEVRKEITNAHLYFIGKYNPESNYYQQLEQLVDTLKLQDYVHFVGYDKNPYRWVAYADCFVFPSRHEGLPNALIEASYLDVPCVATRCLNVITEIIRDGYNGYTVEVDDVDGFAKGMVRAVELRDFKMLYKSAQPLDFINLFKEIVGLNEKN